MTDKLREVVADALPFQARVQPWMLECFGAEIAGDMVERGDRFLEEALELLQSHGYERAWVSMLVDYVWGRPVGEPAQEAGGVMVTLAAYCLAAGIDMHDAGETELARILRPEVVEKIRHKQASKKGIRTPLPTLPSQSAGVEERALLECIDRYWDLAHAEGLERRTQDTEAGDAQKCRHEIEARIAALRTPAASVGDVGREVQKIAQKMQDVVDLADPGEEALLADFAADLRALTDTPPTQQEARAVDGWRAAHMGDVFEAMDALRNGEPWAKVWNELDSKAFRNPMAALTEQSP